jgi:uncharacterized protein (UPF0332 family)
MPYSKLEAAGRIKREAIAIEEVMEALERAKEELEAAREIAERFPSSSFELAYNVMLFAATALLYGEGYRASVERHHKTLVEFAEVSLGPSHVHLIDEFDEARKKRHRTIYDYRKVTRREASHALKVAQRLIEAVELKLTEKGLSEAW